MEAPGTKTGRPHRGFRTGWQNGTAGEGRKPHDRHARRWGVGRFRSTYEAGEQRRPAGDGGGVCGGKGIDQGKRPLSRPRTGHRAGSACQIVWRAYGKQHVGIRRHGKPALLHHVTPQLLWTSFQLLKREARPGVDGVTWEEYGDDGLMGVRINDLHDRVHRGTYRAKPSRRAWIPKADGRQRPLGVAFLEDKIVQQAVKTVLELIHEEDFVGYSYGFRPSRNPHNALDALWVGIRPSGR